MKTMKLSLLALATLLSFSLSNAQTGIGLQAGYDMSTPVYNGTSGKSLNGFHVGPTYDLTIQGPIGLQYGLLYNYLTATETGSYLNGGVTYTSKATAHRLDLPVRLTVSFPLSPGISAFVAGGPNFNYAFSQSVDKFTNYFDSASGVSEGKNIYTAEYESGKKTYAPFDVQLGLGAGLKFNNAGIRVTYDWGVLDRDNRDDSKWTNNDLKVGLFYNF
ncbi:conserved exported hypothetical protein [uncultured Paludibacter sp.]|uniref:Outer membrane protein beta-barrel domain-containing protein n=1 Tax=uncultured Paludibacter sp. TaxID=497635 RepID=A0A653AJZ9_9BACT|nr:conserved exported hypothetical protein [uncultured Paludibacter sp.]